MADDPINEARVDGDPFFGYRFEGGVWRACEGERPSAAPANLRVVVYNVLFDIYDKEIIQSARRYPHLLQIVQEKDADVIIFVEVTKPFMNLVVAQEWVRTGYWVSDVNGQTCRGSTMNYGQMILSRYPVVQQHLNGLSFGKSLISATIALGPDHLIRVSGLHLKAMENFGKARKEQLKKVTKFTNAELEACAARTPPLPLRDVLITGDFNFMHDKEDKYIDPMFTDVWPSLYPSDPGFTFSERRNGLVKAMYPGVGEMRLDRVLHSGTRLRARQAEIIGISPLDLPDYAERILWPSDHFGLVVDFDVLPAAVPSGTTGAGAKL